MYLDIRTLQVATIVVCSVLGPVSIAFGPGQPHMRPSRFWGAGLVALAAGLALVSLHGSVPGYVSQVVGMGLVGLALTFAQSSARSALEVGEHDIVGWAFFGLYLVALLVLDRMDAEAWLRNLVGTGLVGAMSCRVAYGFDPGKDRREGRALHMIGIIFALFGLALLLHAALGTGRTDAISSSEPGVVDAIMLVGLSAGLLLGTILLMWVMTERIHFSMQRLGSIDPLTGALNRSAFVQQVEREIARTQRRADALFGVLLINVDAFRRVNDAYGHAAGDRLLVTVVEILVKMVRQYDLIGRLEGDVFMLLLPGARSDGAASMAERVRREIELKASVHAAIKNRVTVSIGVAVLGEHGDSWDALLRAADAAAKNAKEFGRNRVQIAAALAKPADAATGDTADPAAGESGSNKP